MSLSLPPPFLWFIPQLIRSKVKKPILTAMLQKSCFRYHELCIAKCFLKCEINVIQDITLKQIFLKLFFLISELKRYYVQGVNGIMIAKRFNRLTTILHNFKIITLL